MAIDIRANTTCSLGTVISGSIGDDYIQGNGLIKTQGSVLISGLITPNIGTIVTFEYTKSGITRSIPRKLRVLSSFADPYRRTTQVELGCKLTYLSDLQDPIDWTAFDDPGNADRTEDESRVVTIPIFAKSVMNKCLQKLGITASRNPLTNKFSIATFSFDGGYVPILSDLLVSESYCGYLDFNEVLQVFSLAPFAGTGPVFTSNDIIDLGPIGVGQLPGEAVVVSYSTLRLRPPEPQSENSTPEEEEKEEERQAFINWEKTATFNSPKTYTINFERIDGPYSGEKGVIQYTGSERVFTTTIYRQITVYTPPAFSGGQGKVVIKEVPSSRITQVDGPSVSRDSTAATQYASIGANYNNADIILSLTKEFFEYDDLGNEISSSSVKFEPEAFVLSAVNFGFVYPANSANSNLVAFSASFALMATEYTYNSKKTINGYTRQETSTYLLQALTQNGQQAIAAYRESASDLTLEVAQLLAYEILSNPVVHENTTVTVGRTGASASQERPPAADRVNAYYSEGGDPSNGFRTESQAELELVVGSAAAQRRIELSMPYAPDDTFRVGAPGLGGPGGYFVTASDAPYKANRYGRVQNRLLLGNRNGISLQLAPERLPAAPYSPLYVQANGLTAMYRANGTSWAFDSNGIVASIDALFWAAVGGTGVFWFPVAPGIVTLPSAPSVVDTSPAQIIGTIETVGTTPQAALDAAFPSAVAGDGVQDEATSDFWVYDGPTWTNAGTAPGPTTNPITVILPYNETAIYNGITRTRLDVTKFDYSLELLTEVPTMPIRIRITIQKVIPAAVGSLALAGQDASLLRIVRILTAGTGALTLADNPIRVRPDRLYPTGTGVFALNLQNSALSYSGGDPFWDEVKLLLRGDGDGENDIYVFTDSGPLGLPEVSGGPMRISTARSKFGGSSILTQGGYARYEPSEMWNLGSDDFTIEAWINANNGDSSIIATQADIFTEDYSWRFMFDASVLAFFSTTDPTDLYQNQDSADWSNDFTFDTWIHIAVSRSGNTLRLFKDGVIIYENNSYEISIRSSERPLLIGGDLSSSPFTYIDDLRITKACRYTANFTPPSETFPDFGQTV